MNKKVIGFIVSAVIFFILLFAYAIGGFRLHKDDEVKVISQKTEQKQSQPNKDSNVNPPKEKNHAETGEKSSNTGSNSGNTSSSSNSTDSNSSKTDSNVNSHDEGTSQSADRNSELVNKALEKSNVESDGLSVSMKPTQDRVEDKVYSIDGVISSVELFKNPEGTQAQFKLDITVDLDGKTLNLSYFTTANSASKLKQGSKVKVEYQLTTERAFVVKSLNTK
ncbi:hypothetical protein COF68_05835 [Bacillus toyonensis]|uniref:hypothetical protein n=1 Tax=Bacillus toyonensis TaxID=155322 RepID=UPI000BFB978A|nr:hypothetical protein [Bacillus toyonensis]PHE64360.1 hypothetical protein COF68_05835 [Bacillus toyonensis]